MATVSPTPEGENQHRETLVPSSADAPDVPKQKIDLRQLGEGELVAITHVVMGAMRDVLSEERKKGKKLDPTAIHLQSDNDLAQRVLPPIFDMMRRDSALGGDTRIEFANIKDIITGELIRLFPSEFIVDTDERTPGDDHDTVLEED